MGEPIPTFDSDKSGRAHGRARRGLTSHVIERGLNAVDLIARSDREVERMANELAHVRTERDAARGQLDELRVAFDRLNSAPVLPPQFPPEWVQCIKSKDELIERLALDHQNAREQTRHAADARAIDSKGFNDLLQRERDVTRDVELKLHSAMAQNTADATDLGELRAENLRLLGKLSTAVEQTKKASRLADERQTELTDMAAQLHSAGAKQIAAQEAELALRRVNCDLQEQLLVLRAQPFRPVSAAPSQPPSSRASPVPGAARRGHRSRSASSSLSAVHDSGDRSPLLGLQLTDHDWALAFAAGLISPTGLSPGGFRPERSSPSPTGSSPSRQRRA